VRAAGGDVGGKLHVTRREAGAGDLVVELARAAGDAVQAGLEPLVGPGRALAGSAAADPRGDVPALDERLAERVEARRDAVTGGGSGEACVRVAVGPAAAARDARRGGRRSRGERAGERNEKASPHRI